MFRPTRTALCVAIGAMALAAGEANAGCKYIPSPPGSYVCAAWIKGSEVCDITTVGVTAPAKLKSATCSITGVEFIDGAEGVSGTTGAYCASGALPPGLCTSVVPLSPLLAPLSSSSSTGKAPPKPAKSKPCKVKKPNPGNHFGHPVCDDLIVPGGAVYLTDEATTPVCDEIGTGSGIFNCAATAEILPPPGSTCTDGLPAVDFTASKMLAIMEACVDDGLGGSICAKTYDYCTVDPTVADGTPYNCVDITDQGSECFTSGTPGGPFTFDPDSPLCGTPRSC